MVQKVLHGGAVGGGTRAGQGLAVQTYDDGGNVMGQVHRDGVKIAPTWCRKCCTAVLLAGESVRGGGLERASAPRWCKNCTDMVQKVMHGGAVGKQTNWREGHTGAGIYQIVGV